MPELRWRENKAYGQTYGFISLMLGKNFEIGSVSICLDGKTWLALLAGEEIGLYPTEDEACAATEDALRKALASGIV